MRIGIPFAVLALVLLAMPALAASPEVEAAIKTFRAVAADPNLQKTFCALLKIYDEKDDPNAKAAIDGYVKQLGSEFQSAWDVMESIDDNSPDGQAVDAVLDELEKRCPRNT
jgi:hypothetical protein